MPRLPPLKLRRPHGRSPAHDSGLRASREWERQLFARHFGQEGASLVGDINSDGHVDGFDLLLLAQNFGRSAGTSGPNGSAPARAAPTATPSPSRR